MTSQEAVREAIDYLNSPVGFIDPTGGLKYGVNGHISVLVLYNFTRAFATS